MLLARYCDHAKQLVHAARAEVMRYLIYAAGMAAWH